MHSMTKEKLYNGGMRYALSFWGSLTREGEVPLVRSR